jgi:hypothetical protein
MKAKNQGMPAMILLALVVAGMMISGVYGYWRDFWLNQDAKQTGATITVGGLKPGAYDYSYVVNGIQYVGHGQRGITLGEDSHVGGETLVYFSSSHPWLSSPQIPGFSMGKALAIIALYLVSEFYIIRTAIRIRRGVVK